jgi:hypothetical protein
MTLDEAMAKATDALDEVYRETLAAAADMAIALDATPEEYEAFMKWQTEMLATDRAEKLADLRAWLSRGGKTAH